MGERRGRGKQRNMKRGLMDTDNGGAFTVGGQGGGEQWGKRWDNCNSTTITKIKHLRKYITFNNKNF